MENRKYWSGTQVDRLQENEVFVYGSNVLLSFKKKYP